MVLNLEYLEAAAYIAVISTCATLVWHRDAAPPTRALAQSVAGKPLKLRGVQWSNTRINVVVAMRSDCHFCQESLPYFRELTKLSAGKPVSIIMVSPENKSVFAKFLNDAGLWPNVVIADTPLSSFGVSGTPAMFLVDGKGTVRRALVGKLGADGQDYLTKVVESGAIV
jgi:thiol-disulfide isomerase/thioredoxin